MSFEIIVNPSTIGAFIDKTMIVLIILMFFLVIFLTKRISYREDMDIVNWIIYILGGILLIGFLGEIDPIIVKEPWVEVVDLIKGLISMYILYVSIIYVEYMVKKKPIIKIEEISEKEMEKRGKKIRRLFIRRKKSG